MLGWLVRLVFVVFAFGVILSVPGFSWVFSFLVGLV